MILAGLEAISDTDYDAEFIALKARMRYYKAERRRLFDAYGISKDADTFRECIQQIDRDEADVNRRYGEIESLIAKAQATPSQAEINTACETMVHSIEDLTFEQRRSILEALKIKVHVGKAVRIEGVLPIVLPSTRAT